MDAMSGLLFHIPVIFPIKHSAADPSIGPLAVQHQPQYSSSGCPRQPASRAHWYKVRQDQRSGAARSHGGIYEGFTGRRGRANSGR